MPTPVSSIPNLGPATEKYFAQAGIHDAEQLRELGADEAYRRWLAAGLPPHFIGYYALVMGLQGRPWNDCTGDEKKQLRAKFDAIKLESRQRPEQTGLPSDIEIFLNRFGLRPAG